MGFKDCLMNVVEGGIITRAEAQMLADAFDEKFAEKRLSLGDDAAAAAAKDELARELKAEANEIRRRAHLAEAARRRLKADMQGYRNIDGEHDVAGAAVAMLSHYGYRGLLVRARPSRGDRGHGPRQAHGYDVHLPPRPHRRAQEPRPRAGPRARAARRGNRQAGGEGARRCRVDRDGGSPSAVQRGGRRHPETRRLGHAAEPRPGQDLETGQDHGGAPGGLEGADHAAARPRQDDRRAAQGGDRRRRVAACARSRLRSDHDRRLVAHDAAPGAGGPRPDRHAAPGRALLVFRDAAAWLDYNERLGRMDRCRACSSTSTAWPATSRPWRSWARTPPAW